MSMMALNLASWRVAKSKASFPLLCRCCKRSYVTNDDPFREHERIILQSKTKDHLLPRLTEPLKEGGRIKLAGGNIEVNQILGKRPRDILETRKGNQWRLNRPTLAEYVLYTPRIVTPVYPADANLIVSLLDIHPPPADAPSSMPFEILEAGTGHGSLTLHLSRAIHSFNGLRPISPELYHSSESLPEDSASSGASETRPLNFSPEDLESYEKWRSGRRAILHSLEASPKHLEHAKGVVQGFNFGLYSGNVDFHSASLRPWLSSLSKERPAPFLSHAILDLPQVSEELEGVARAMLANGTVIVFVPSITQIVKCAQLVKERDIPLYLDDVLELGSGAGTGGRQWNVKAVKPRALLKAEAEARLRLQEEDSAEQNRFDQDESAESEDGDTGDGGAGGGWEMICRPKAFGRIVGGGFVGIWKRNRDFK